jgi:hypothetical protein
VSDAALDDTIVGLAREGLPVRLICDRTGWSRWVVERSLRRQGVSLAVGRPAGPATMTATARVEQCAGLWLVLPVGQDKPVFIGTQKGSTRMWARNRGYVLDD